jgi:hypothetical protein
MESFQIPNFAKNLIFCDRKEISFVAAKAVEMSALLKVISVLSAPNFQQSKKMMKIFVLTTKSI